MPIGVIRLVWGLNPQTGKWDGPFPRGWVPGKYCVIRWKQGGRWYSKNRCGGRIRR